LFFPTLCETVGLLIGHLYGIVTCATKSVRQRFAFSTIDETVCENLLNQSLCGLSSRIIILILLDFE